MAEAALARIEEWADFAEEALNVATANPGDLKLRDEVAGVAEDRWGKREAILHIWEEAGPRPKTEVGPKSTAADAALAKPGRRKLSAEPKGPSFFGPGAQPSIAEPSIEIAQGALESKDAAMAVAEVRKVEAGAVPALASVLVDMDAPYEVARRFLIDRYSLNGVATLRWWCGEWRKWVSTHYAEMEEDALRAELYEFLAKANGGKFDPGPRHVNAVVDGIKARVLLGASVEVGAWLDDGEAPWGAGEIVCCKNGVQRLSDGKLWPHDPRLFALNVVETEYQPEALAPRWEQFLEELWGEDWDTRNALQEFFGLVLTDETKFQKGFILVGPARSGKGTIARVLMHLLGRNNYCGPTLGQLAQTFGMQGLIGKKIAVVPDARLDNRANRSVITEKLLSIIGEDVQDINRKNKPYWNSSLSSPVPGGVNFPRAASRCHPAKAQFNIPLSSARSLLSSSVSSLPRKLTCVCKITNRVAITPVSSFKVRQLIRQNHHPEPQYPTSRVAALP
jgi:hypothetical protein